MMGDGWRHETCGTCRMLCDVCDARGVSRGRRVCVLHAGVGVVMRMRQRSRACDDWEEREER
ncbi:MAG: hypothetical protein ACI364_06820 [Coriobacteriales bacterium]